MTAMEGKLAAAEVVVLRRALATQARRWRLAAAEAATETKCMICNFGNDSVPPRRADGAWLRTCGRCIGSNERRNMAA